MIILLLLVVLLVLTFPYGYPTISTPTEKNESFLSSSDDNCNLFGVDMM